MSKNKMPQFLSLDDLRERGWTAASVKHSLGNPDTSRRNPDGPRMVLYSLGRVEAFENTPAWDRVRTRNDSLRGDVAKNAEIERACSEEHLDTCGFSIPLIPMITLTRRACDFYNQLSDEMFRENAGVARPDASTKCDQKFLDRIAVNYVRHCFTTYDEDMEAESGVVGGDYEHDQVNTRVCRAISAAYPALAGECERQLFAKRSETRMKKERVARNIGRKKQRAAVRARDAAHL